MGIVYLTGFIAAIFWLIVEATSVESLGVSMSEVFRRWFIRICEILFAAAALSLMFSLARITL